MRGKRRRLEWRPRAHGRGSIHRRKATILPPPANGKDNREAMPAYPEKTQTLELSPDFGGAYLRLGEAYEQKGMYKEAIAVLRQRLTMPDRRPGLALISSLGHAYAVAGQRAEAQKMLNELHGLTKTRYVSAYHVGLIYTGLGDKEQAFHWLGKAADEGFHQLIWLKVEPRFAPLRSDPRFADLVRRIGLPQ
jgi:tetratricopeptide (TPR) repeat protein